MGCVTSLIKCTVNTDTLGAWGNLRAALLVYTFSLPRMVGGMKERAREREREREMKERRGHCELCIFLYVTREFSHLKTLLKKPFFRGCFFPRGLLVKLITAGAVALPSIPNGTVCVCVCACVRACACACACVWKGGGSFNSHSPSLSFFTIYHPPHLPSIPLCCTSS